MKISNLENVKLHDFNNNRMKIKLVTLLVIGILVLLLHVPFPSYAEPTVVWDFQGYTFFDSTPGNLRVFFTITDDSKANNG